jgi:hypothetical protein
MLYDAFTLCAACRIEQVWLGDVIADCDFSPPPFLYAVLFYEPLFTSYFRRKKLYTSFWLCARMHATVEVLRALTG